MNKWFFSESDGKIRVQYDMAGFAYEVPRGRYDEQGFIRQWFDIDDTLPIFPDVIVDLISEYFQQTREEDSKKECGLMIDEANRIDEWNDFTESSSDVYVIIGNGVDIECGLPTSYGDFLKFLSVVNDIILFDQISVRKEKIKESELNEIAKRSLLSRVMLIDDENWDKVRENFWYKHFCNANIKSGWVDFENEISNVIKTVEESMEYTRYRRASMDDYVGCSESALLLKMLSSILTVDRISSKEKDRQGYEYIEFNILYSDLRDILLTDLNQFIYAFEVYLREYVEKASIELSDNIRFLVERLLEAEERHILSFNYTHTFENILRQNYPDEEFDFCYVHGRIGDGNGKNTMVLGIDEHLPERAQSSFTGFSAFRKYNQRIYKGTDSNYMDWLDEIEEAAPTDRMLYVFGHSIGLTDRDILRAFITASDMRTVVFYHNEDAFLSQVANMTAIIGKDDMIKRTGSKRHTMEFRKQV